MQVLHARLHLRRHLPCVPRHGESQDHAVEAERMASQVIYDSMFVLEPCKACDGTGRLGTCGRYLIFCEKCEGAALIWVERNYIGEE